MAEMPRILRGAGADSIEQLWRKMWWTLHY